MDEARRDRDLATRAARDGASERGERHLLLVRTHPPERPSHAPSRSAATLLRRACEAVGWSPPPGDLEDVVAFCRREVQSIPGALDRAHALAAIESAIDGARNGDFEYALGGLRDAAKDVRERQ